MSDDVLALQQLQSAYADVVSRRAWPELDRLFLPDVTIEVDTVTSPARLCRGVAEFTGFVSAACERFDHFQFVILNSVVETAGEDATGRIFMCEIRHHRDEQVWSTAYGMYRDQYRRVEGTWWFSTRHYRSLARTGPVEGVFGVPEGLQQIGR